MDSTDTAALTVEQIFGKKAVEESTRDPDKLWAYRKMLSWIRIGMHHETTEYSFKVSSKG